MWLEMSRDEVHGGGEWSFTKCLWAPSHKRDAGTWRYWDLLRQVKDNDLIIHLRGKGKNAAFVGYSIAEGNAEETIDRPPNPGKWDFAKSFLRVRLRDYVPFADPANLYALFRERDALLRDYFLKNKDKGRRQRHPIFYVVQANRLQCLNGAYFSELDTNLLGALFGVSEASTTFIEPAVTLSTTTREQFRYMAVRVGQADFSSEVRKNFGCRCCFPGCSINESALLVGAHIARWADSSELRGKVSNGLCLCLMHDKAFEEGWFTLDAELCVVLKVERLTNSAWAASHLVPYAGKRISIARVTPGFASIREHWRRTGFRFDADDILGI